MKSLILFLCLLAGVSGCELTGNGVWPQATLARSHSASDIATYRVQRVAVVPFTGSDLTADSARDLEDGLALELAPRVSFEIVQLSAADLAEIPRAEPYRRGWYASRTLLEIAERFRVDAILVGTVREFSAYTPQRIATQVELVSCETGQIAWSSSVELDARNTRVIKAIEAWCVLERGSDNSPGDEALAYLSPAVFARFATRELARSYQ
jgi:TolB-like protein